MNKWFGVSLGALVGISHLGMIGMIATRNNVGPGIPPVGPYTSFAISAGKDGSYKMSYQANDPKTMYKTTSIENKGLIKRYKKSIADEYTMDGATHTGVNGNTAVGKLSAQDVACIKAEGGGASTGRVVGASMGAAAAPAFTGIPFIGPVLGGLIALGGADQGGKIGGQLATEFNDACDETTEESTD